MEDVEIKLILNKSYWNKKINLGVCADWFVGPRLEAGWISANDLFNKISK